ncbi:MAG TPA: cellulase family glycosylhydrolase [Streptosporangiaceae bacterium]|nr:cellulase family glycosylhydrolase [Streptosporangiaceae bacterium]
MDVVRNSRRRGLLRRGGERRPALLAALSSIVMAAGTVLVALTVSATPAAAAGTGTGFLRTNGNKIVDSTGATVRLTGINWFGMETDNHTFHGLWAGRNATWQMQIDHMAQLGFNTIRVPYTGDSLRPGAQATSINTDSNPDLIGLSPLQILDKVVERAGQRGMRIILDRHRPSAAGQTPLWYTSSVSEASMIADWQMLAQRYAGNPTVIGADLFNEPHAEGTDPNGTGACWGCGVTARDWRLAAQRIGNAVLSANSNWLIFVEGVSCPSGGTPNSFDNIPDDPLTCDWWGGNLAAAAQFPVQLNVANRLVYAPHDYGISVFDRQPWFNDPNFPNNLPDIWDHFWGYLSKNNAAPIMLGEFGSTLANPLDTQWLTRLMSYLTSNGMSFTYWAWNPNSGDTGGIVQDDWVTVNQNKMNIIGPSLVPPVGGTPTTTPPSTSNPPGGTVSCTTSYALTNSWQGGFQAGLTVTNSGSSTWNNWRVTWTMPSGVTLSNGWNATVTQSGTTFTAQAPSHATSLAPNASATIGFTANGASSPGATNIACS